MYGMVNTCESTCLISGGMFLCNIKSDPVSNRDLCQLSAPSLYNKRVLIHASA